MQSLSDVHGPQAKLEHLATAVEGQSELSMHWTHVPSKVLHTGVRLKREQWLLAAHGTQVLLDEH